MDNTQLIQQMAATILEAIKKGVDSEGLYDRTFKGIIERKVGPATYELKYNGQTLTAHSSLSLSVGDVVMVCAPQNNWNDLFVVTRR